MKRLGCVVAIASGAVLLSPMVASAACSSALVPAQNVASNSFLNAVTGLNPSDVWAVGQSGSLNACGSQTLTEHSAGSGFSIVPSPASGSLVSVAEVAPNDVWAVGSGCSHQELIEHWDGSAWSVLPNDGPDPLASVSAPAGEPKFVWSVGYHYQAHCILPIGCNEPIANHWNPTTRAWHSTVVPLPAGDVGILTAVSTLASGKVWAAGVATSLNTGDHPLVEHWNGRRWTRVVLPFHRGYPTSIVALNDSDVWVGGYFLAIDQLDGTFVLHWDGSAWTIHEVKKPGMPLSSIAVLDDNDVWAEDSMTPPTSPDVGLPLLRHFDGVNWTDTPTPADGLDTTIQGLAAIQGEIWWVGYALPAFGFSDITVVATTLCTKSPAILPSRDRVR